jgi:hypothetical protein
LSEDVAVIADCFGQTPPKDWWARLLVHAHGVLLRRLGKTRVVYLIRRSENATYRGLAEWCSNVNLVTGLTATWLDDNFEPGTSEEEYIVVR